MLPSHILISFSIILTSTPRSFKWSLSLRFICGNPVSTSPLPTCYTARPSHSSIFDYASKIWWGVRLIKLLNISLHHSSHVAQISSSAPHSWTPFAYVPPSVSQIKFHKHTNQLAKRVSELLLLLLLLLLLCCLLSHALSSWYSIIIIIIIIMLLLLLSLVTWTFFLVLLLNQWRFPPLKLQVSGCSNFRICVICPFFAVFM